MQIDTIAAQKTAEANAVSKAIKQEAAQAKQIAQKVKSEQANKKKDNVRKLRKRFCGKPFLYNLFVCFWRHCC